MTTAGWLVGILVGVNFLVAAVSTRPTLRIVYNASDSAPRGWYVVVPADHLRVGQYVVARLPEDIGVLAASRGYVPRSVPVLKRIAAIGGQRVCIRGAAVYIDGVEVARVLDADLSKRPLTAWRRCRPLVQGELFLLNADVPQSFDSRYFGPVDISFVRGRAILLTTIATQ